MTLKRVYQAASPEIKNFRRRWPERGIRQVYGISGRDTVLQNESVERTEVTDLDNLPAFSTPYLRNKLSPMRRSVSEPLKMSVIRYRAVDQREVQNYGNSMQLEVRKFARNAYNGIM